MVDGICIACPPGMNMEDGECVKCPNGQVYKDIWTCVDCPNGQVEVDGFCKGTYFTFHIFYPGYLVFMLEAMTLLMPMVRTNNRVLKLFFIILLLYIPLVDLYLISEKSIWKNQVRRTGFQT